MRVGIVGAGITGLTLTHYLVDQGIDVVALESSDRPGGVIETRQTAGTVLELGPQRIRLSGPLTDLVSGLGLEAEVLRAPPDLPLFVYAGGRLRRVPRSLATFLRTDLLSWRGKLRVLAEPLTATGDPDETAAALFTRKFGPEAYRNVIGPLFGGIYGSDPAVMPARYALEGLLALERREGSLLKPALRRALGRATPPAVTFEAGMARLPQALYDRHGDRIALDTPVTDIRPAEEGYVLETTGADESVTEVVLTAPAPIVGDLLDGLAPGAAGLSSLRYNPLALVYLRADADHQGLGYQVRRDEPLRTLGVSWNGPTFGRDGLYTCFLGGMGDPDIVDAPIDAIASIAREEFETVMGCRATVLETIRLPRGFPAYDDTWHALAELSVPDGVHLATNYTDRMGVPSRVRQAKALATELADRAR